MSGMSVGGARIALVEVDGGMLVEAYKSRLALVLAVIDNGRIGSPSIGYGSDGHKAALDGIERQIKQTRASIRTQELEEERQATLHGDPDGEAL